MIINHTRMIVHILCIECGMTSYDFNHWAPRPSSGDFWMTRICILEIHYCIFQSPCSTGFRLRTWFTLWKFVKNSSYGENEWIRRDRPPAMMIDCSKTMVCDPGEMNQAVLRHGIAQTCAQYVRHHESFLLWPKNLKYSKPCIGFS